MLPTLHTTALIQSKDTRQTQSGKQVTSLRLSVGEKDKNGDYSNFYFNATFWEQGSQFVDKHFNEGDIIEVKGDLITTSYTKQDGSKVYQTELRFPKAGFPSKPKTQNVNNNEAPLQGQYSQQQNTTTQNQKNELSSQQQSAPYNIPEFDVNTYELPF
jgi:single-stranded DNA-binding protein